MSDNTTETTGSEDVASGVSFVARKTVHSLFYSKILTLSRCQQMVDLQMKTEGLESNYICCTGFVCLFLLHTILTQAKW